MNLAVAAGQTALNAYTDLFSGATLTFYSGTQPSTPETALSGNTALVAFTFSTPAFGSGSFASGEEAQTASFVSSSVTPSNNGTATFARAVFTSPAAWSSSHAYSVGTTITNNSNYYTCVVAGTSASSGGPTTTGPYILDGSAVWQYYSATTGSAPGVLGDFTIGTSGTDIVIGSTTISTTVNVSMTSFKLQLPAV